jgi:hypothetical protein
MDSLKCVNQKEDNIRKKAILFPKEKHESAGTTNSLF